MTKFITIIAIFLGVLFYLNPTIDEHKSSIETNSPETLDVAEDLDDPDSSFWDDVSYANFYIFSGTKSISKKTMISIGMAKCIIVVDNKWPYVQDS